MNDAQVRNLKAALAEFVQEHMPWPFSDVSRHDAEGTDTAWVIAESLMSPLLSEFSSIADTAKETKRKTYPVKSHD